MTCFSLTKWLSFIFCWFELFHAVKEQWPKGVTIKEKLKVKRGNKYLFILPIYYCQRDSKSFVVLLMI